MGLQEEITERSNKISTDTYPMSIGELISLYKEGEIDIHPEFQRVFRWDEFQKTRLIESIMLNIPIPSIFVSQNDEGVWDVIDGVQRLSTIFQFVGIFKDENGEFIKPLILKKTDYLPSFEGMKWEDEESNKSFTKQQQLVFKRARINIIIIKKESDQNTKYELFQRLNTGGTNLSNQEVRNCLMIMVNRNFYTFIKELSENNDFKQCVAITDRKEDEQFRLELILRLFTSVDMENDTKYDYNDLKELLDKETIKFIDKIKEDDYKILKDKFNRTFELLNKLLGEDSFKKYSDNVHKGPFLTSAFQGIATGVFSNINVVESKDEEEIKKRIRSFYSEKGYEASTVPGARSVPKFKELTLLGKEFFKYENS